MVRIRTFRKTRGVLWWLLLVTLGVVYALGGIANHDLGTTVGGLAIAAGIGGILVSSRVWVDVENGAFVHRILPFVRMRFPLSSVTALSIGRQKSFVMLWRQTDRMVPLPLLLVRPRRPVLAQPVATLEAIVEALIRHTPEAVHHAVVATLRDHVAYASTGAPLDASPLAGFLAVPRTASPRPDAAR